MAPPRLTLLRHATLLIELGGERILIDPMLDAAGARGPIANTPQPRDNPLVELPEGAGTVLERASAALVTHLHADHLDDAGAAFLARAGVPVLGQAEDLATLREHGIADVAEIGSGAVGEVTVRRTGGRHAHDEALAGKLGPGSGAVLGARGARGHVAGDTLPCPPLPPAPRAPPPAADRPH